MKICIEEIARYLSLGDIVTASCPHYTKEGTSYGVDFFFSLEMKHVEKKKTLFRNN